MVERQKKDFKTEKERYEWSRSIERDLYLEASKKLKVAEEKIADMKKAYGRISRFAERIEEMNV